MPSLEVLPVIDVQNDNITELWPTLLLAVRSSTFIALDMELSGLGDRRELNAKEVETRYQALGKISRTRSVISVGLCCFKQKPITETLSTVNDDASSASPNTVTAEYVIQTFNILMLCSEEYIVEPMSLKFLVDHNFDFNRQYSKGIPYHGGPDRPKPDKKERQWLRELFATISLQKIPIVFHNAFVDLGFLYQCFHTNMPAKMPVFLADIAELFPGGVFDTKYITEFQARFPASYLEYVFRKCQRDNRKAEAEKKRHFSLSTLNYPTPCWYITYLPCAELPPISQDIQVCDNFAAYGWCPRASKCQDSHDINLILDNDEKNVERKRKKNRRKRKAKEIQPEKDSTEQTTTTATEQEESMDVSEEPSQPDGEENDIIPSNVCDTETDTQSNTNSSSALTESKQSNKANLSRTAGHRAGFDSFMTGFIFAHFIEKLGSGDSKSPGSLACMDAHRNKVALGGKDFPLSIGQSSFAKTSKEHKDRMEAIRS